MTTIPLFPLHTVLYPFAPIALHVFEERYRAMIEQCLEQSSSFGVVQIRSGHETNPNDPYLRQLRGEVPTSDPDPAPTIPYAVGTTVRMNECIRFDDGRYYLSAVGQRRFRMQRIMHHEPYLIASVVFLPDTSTPELAALAETTRTLYTRYWQAIAIVTGQREPVVPLPEDPIELSYALAHQLRVAMRRKQRWLEADANLRLRELVAALRNELALMPGSQPGNDKPWTVD